LIRHIGLSNVTARQVSDAQKLTPIVCVQNQYNVANRQDDPLIDELAAQNIAWVPFFPSAVLPRFRPGSLTSRRFA
jgi:aryl-alcohol dehydrogenase-like predicted oxidoreductase